MMEKKPTPPIIKYILSNNGPYKFVLGVLFVSLNFQNVDNAGFFIFVISTSYSAATLN